MAKKNYDCKLQKITSIFRIFDFDKTLPIEHKAAACFSISVSMASEMQVISLLSPINMKYNPYDY